MDAVDIEAGDQVHTDVDQVLEALGMAGIEGPVAVLGPAAQPRRPVVIGVGGVAVLTVDLPVSGLESDDPAVNLDPLLAAGGVVGRVDHGLEGVEIGRAQAGHVGLAHAGGIAHIGPAADLHDDRVAVGLADAAFAGRIASLAEQEFDLGLVQEAGAPRIDPEGPIFIRGCSERH